MFGDTSSKPVCYKDAKLSMPTNLMTLIQDKETRDSNAWWEVNIVNPWGWISSDLSDGFAKERFWVSCFSQLS